MVKAKTHYNAIIEKEGTEPFVVDIFNLPRDQFDAEHPLIITESVNLGRGKKQPLPDFSNVVIKGTFDCSDFTITENSVLPNGIRELFCEYSISDLFVLKGILPESVKLVHVRTALLNKIKNNFTDPAFYKELADFLRYNMGVDFTDGKQTLVKIVDSAIRQEEHAEKQKAIKKEKNKKTKTTQLKTSDWFAIDEIVDLIRRHMVIDGLNDIPEIDMLRLVERARSRKANRLIKTQIMERKDGVDVVCVHKNDMDALYQNILDMIEADKSRQNKTTVATQQETKPSKKTENKTTVAEPVKYYVGNVAVEPIEIKKYIPKSIWGAIQTACGSSQPLMNKILSDINVINVNPANTMGRNVVYIQDNTVKTSQTVRFKNAQCLCQGFGKVNDRPRIVWGMCGNIFVCTDFFAEHEKKYKTAYNNAMRNMNLDLSKINLSEYYLVSDLLNEFPSQEQTEVAQEQTPVVTEPVKEERTEAAQKTQEKTVIQPEPTTEKKPAVIPAKLEPQVETKIKTKEKLQPQAQKDEPKTEIKTVVQDVNKANIEWVDIASLHTQFVVRLGNLSDTQKKIAYQIQQETDTEKSLQLTEELRSILYMRKETEDTLNKLEQMNATLLKIKEMVQQKRK